VAGAEAVVGRPVRVVVAKAEVPARAVAKAEVPVGAPPRLEESATGRAVFWQYCERREEHLMRTTVLLFACMLSISGSVAAQEWELYVNTQDGFKVDFPGQPKVTETTWKSEYDYMLPARVYSVDKGREHYSMTVVDYNGIRQMGTDRSAKCPPGAETCQGQRAGGLVSVIGPAYSTQDIRGALVYASFKFIQRDAKVTHYLWNWEDLVEGHEIHLTNNADQSRTMAYIAMHENKLYILEGTVPKGYPEPGLFYQSLGWVDKDGNGIRYQTIYSNAYHGLREYPVPPHGRGGGGGAVAPAGGVR
jgi:hypothetical protein